jgi:hypothetical protein
MIVCLMTISCSKKNDDPVAALPNQTDFDISTIEKRVYAFGDTVKADMNIKPNYDIKEIEPQYIIYTSFNPRKTDGAAYFLPKQSANGSNPFVYKFRFPLTNPDLKGKAGARVIIFTSYTKPQANTATGDKVVEFDVVLK